ncbi:hypothetical protein BUALT_Bualt16G0016300 [Buddleja alternifolia]|uniref:F-box domain-containing protein n=1 Tax=Buddleja alternifolia TaxID=168488 RepID=A0AAV6W9S8_9LAMI|nr:hypothetical protein BUALT_Bualt16G0016300 [Buddleja alternifolia]
MERRNRKIRPNSDRLSSLPDSLLCHILSFLPTKLSVATSVLSTRWKYLWTDVLNLDFDSINHKKKSGHGLSITDTVSRVMLLSNARNINSFRLIIQDEKFDEVDLLETWIRTTIARNVQAIDIRLLHQVCLPRCLFACKTLVDLSLHCCGSIPDYIMLPNLKKLRLHYFQYGNYEKLQNLISGCPVLEELNLNIEMIIKYDLRSCIISSPTIKWLTLNLGLFDLDDDFSDYKLVMNTPAVRYLVVEDLPSQCFLTGTFNSLVEANICLYNYEVQDDVSYCNSVLDLVDKVNQVKCLTLSITHNRFLDCSYADVTSRFINLTKLDLRADWLFLLKFLQSADNLEVLIIREHADVGVKRWTEPQQVPTCLSSHLKQVTIDAFEYLEAEHKMISYILSNGKVLNMMDIIIRKEEKTKYTDLEKKSNALRRISAFERRSETCKLQFS